MPHRILCIVCILVSIPPGGMDNDELVDVVIHYVLYLPNFYCMPAMYGGSG